MEKNSLSGTYTDESYISFMIPPEEKDSAIKIYQMTKKELEKLNYDIDADISVLREMISQNGIINLAERYIERL